MRPWVSAISARVNPTTPNFDAQYAVASLSARSPSVEATVTTRPRRASRSGSAARTTACWAGPLGAVSPLLRPSWLTAEPRTTASTVSLRVQLPTDTPLAFVSVKPVPGWTAQVTTTTLNPPIESHGTTITEAVSQVTWTADPGAGIRPGEYQTFSLSAGPLPDVESLTLPAIQGYDDGSEVVFTLYRRDRVTDAEFAEDAAAIEADLESLRAILEA